MQFFLKKKATLKFSARNICYTSAMEGLTQFDKAPGILLFAATAGNLRCLLHTALVKPTKLPNAQQAALLMKWKEQVTDKF